MIKRFVSTGCIAWHWVFITIPTATTALPLNCFGFISDAPRI